MLWCKKFRQEIDMVFKFQEIQDIGPKAKCPWTEGLFSVDDSSPKLEGVQAENFHTHVAKALYACKHA